MLEVYENMRRYFGEKVHLVGLECMTALSLIERGLITDLNSIHDAFNSLAIQFPDKIYVMPGAEGKSPLAYIDTKDLEV